MSDPNTSSTEDDSSLLAVVIDMNPFLWGQRSFKHEKDSEDKPITFVTLMDHLLLFLHAYLMLKEQNLLAVIANNISESKYLFPRPKTGTTTEDIITSCDFLEVKEVIERQLHDSAADKMDTSYEHGSTVSGGLSLALCYINRVTKARPQVKPRILVLQISPDVSSHYIPTMNCIFSAQRKSIPVDVCMLAQKDSAFLQQAAQLTNGIYIKPVHQEGLLQYFMSCFLADSYTRRFINLPTQIMVDYRASCFCHKKVIDIGFVCSVCLSVFCQFYDVCITCGATFDKNAR